MTEVIDGYRSADDVNFEKFFNIVTPVRDATYKVLPGTVIVADKTQQRELEILKPMEFYVRNLYHSNPEGVYKFKGPTGSKWYIPDNYRVMPDTKRSIRENSVELLKGALYMLNIKGIKIDELGQLDVAMHMCVLKYGMGVEDAELAGNAIKRIERVADREIFYKVFRREMIVELNEIKETRTLSNLILKQDLTLEQRCDESRHVKDDSLEQVEQRKLDTINKIRLEDIPECPVGNVYRNYLKELRDPTVKEPQKNQANIATLMRYLETSMLLKTIETGGVVEDLISVMTDKAMLDACIEEPQLYKMFVECGCAPATRKLKRSAIPMELF